MKVAVINEVSAALRNADIIHALSRQEGVEVSNLGMTAADEEPQLSYIQTAIMSAILLENNICDMVIGGCGTGQGYVNAVMQFPGITCGLINDPLDAWLFSQINAGNCVSLALHKGYGWAADINLQYIFEKLFKDVPGGGYPVSRKQPQANSREVLSEISRVAHPPLLEILQQLDDTILQPIADKQEFMDVLKNNPVAQQYYQLLKN